MAEKSRTVTKDRIRPIAVIRKPEDRILAAVVMMLISLPLAKWISGADIPYATSSRS